MNMCESCAIIKLCPKRYDISYSNVMGCDDNKNLVLGIDHEDVQGRMVSRHS